jgi:hypothetical protein
MENTKKLDDVVDTEDNYVDKDNRSNKIYLSQSSSNWKCDVNPIINFLFGNLSCLHNSEGSTDDIRPTLAFDAVHWNFEDSDSS